MWEGYKNYDHYFAFNRVYEWLTEIKLSNPEWIHVKKKDWWNIPASFDIETSSFKIGEEKYATMYLWAMCINGSTIIGRTWGEFIRLVDIISEAFHTKRMKLVIYVHNLSYEFQWFRKYFDIKKVFSIKNRHVINVTLKNGIIFKCSYKLSNYALEYIGDELITKYKVEKDVGNLDYQLVRHSASQLADSEIWYNVHDVQVVTSFIQEKLENEGNISTIPLTNTGYVRNHCRASCFTNFQTERKLIDIASYLYHDKMKALQLRSVNEYNILKWGFAGGFTHTAMIHANKLRRGMKGADLCSSYPTECCAEKYPMGSGVFAGKSTVEKLHSLQEKDFCFICMITLHNVTPKFIYEGYISLSKCLTISNDYVVNNGRVYSASQLAIVITNIDLEIIEKCYEYDDIEVDSLRYYHSDYLPKPLIISILNLYSKKTTLKGIEDKVVEYMVSKNLLNACFGMMVTDIVRDEIVYSDNKWSVVKADAKTQLDIYNNSYNRFLFYPWGVWVTAYARRNLWSAIFEFGEDYVYTDTDSIKGLHFEKHMKYFEEYNKDITRKLEIMCDRYKISKDLIKPRTKPTEEHPNGVEKPLGHWEIEDDYVIFKALGAKRYIYEVDGILYHTISGVNKKYGVPYLIDTYGYKGRECDRERVRKLLRLFYRPSVDEKSKVKKAKSIIKKLRKSGVLDYENVLKHFSNKLVFPKEHTGKSTLTYLDEPFEVDCTDYNGKTLEIRELSAIHMEQQEYNLGLDDYLEFLEAFVKEDR